MSENDVAVFSDFLSSVPPSLTFALVNLAPCISTCKAAIQISTWSSSWYHSWLALASWWAVCLLLDHTLRLFLPFVVFAIFAIARLLHKARPVQPLATENTLRTIIADLSIIQATLQSPSLSTSITLPKLLRVAVISYIPYILFSFFVSLRVIIGLAGTVVLTWRAPWATVLRATVWRSTWLRWCVYKIWSFLSGNPLPPRTMSLQPSSLSSSPVQSLRFLFTIYENQRWWMGLDWTAALLPAERPSWCSASQHPISPPSAFTLPADTTVYFPDSKGGRLKRKATWKWEEPEWRVLVRKDGAGLSRVERPLPTVKEETPNTSRLRKAAGMLRDSGSLGNLTNSATSDTKDTPGNPDTEHISEEFGETADEEPLTDTDGWVYGDNKWEGQSNRGGMGKYTRHRKWTRVAVVFETVEHVEPGNIGIRREEPPSSDIVETQASDHAASDVLNSDNPPDSPLRQRLRMALNKGA
ncbi:Peroxin/Dysferlin domain-containing protein [Crassisporium funariophilum]|nr:Peroxin/Dysferlin domain-containing protein [Crassisporium funariophilum]